jgi:hypothetical protein
MQPVWFQGDSSIAADEPQTPLFDEPLLLHSSRQCWGAETICIGSSSGSDLKQSRLRLQLGRHLFAQLFIIHVEFSRFFGKNTDLRHLLDPVQNEL